MSINKEINWPSIGILIVDDQKGVRDTLHFMLSTLGVTQVFEAKDGVEALAFASTVKDMISIVICDWNMPRMTGIDLLKQLRGKRLKQHFLMITGRADLGSVEEARIAGVAGYLLKPFSLADLQEKMTIALHRSEDTGSP